MTSQDPSFNLSLNTNDVFGSIKLLIMIHLSVLEEMFGMTLIKMQVMKLQSIMQKILGFILMKITMVFLTIMKGIPLQII